MSSIASVGIHTNRRNPCLKMAACPMMGIPSITFGVHTMRCRVYANNTTQWSTMDGRTCGRDPVARLAPFVLVCATYMRRFRTDGSHPPPLAGGGPSEEADTEAVKPARVSLSQGDATPNNTCTVTSVAGSITSGASVEATGGSSLGGASVGKVACGTSKVTYFFPMA